ncbi:hypothetical protein ANN_27705 [Periplaneta americana]|uniref:Uncharacterized protein n=1 Tax=Periplaneta americana TaxID=6978 RepID=A0ABQ8RV34_PERAM|nr:hypothetical protein ANN_27705 [Periplaneta americana]
MADGEGELVVSSCEKPKKRVRKEENWKRKRSKVCRNLGLEYVSDKTNVLVPAKQQGAGSRGDRNLLGVTKKQDFENNDDVVLQDEHKDDLIFSKVSPHVDKRGLHGNYKHKLSPSVVNGVVNHIKKFPLYVSHYRRTGRKINAAKCKDLMTYMPQNHHSTYNGLRPDTTSDDTVEEDPDDN